MLMNKKKKGAEHNQYTYETGSCEHGSSLLRRVLQGQKQSLTTVL